MTSQMAEVVERARDVVKLRDALHTSDVTRVAPIARERSLFDAVTRLSRALDALDVYGTDAPSLPTNAPAVSP